ncbi:hypothetical protein LR48_Vigan2311s000100 [Vigna angularis]|nr:hypothetical protein LR48_Vigan2311s000100 [Vigna angularis]
MSLPFLGFVHLMQRKVPIATSSSCTKSSRGQIFLSILGLNQETSLSTPAITHAQDCYEYSMG